MQFFLIFWGIFGIPHRYSAFQMPFYDVLFSWRAAMNLHRMQYIAVIFILFYGRTESLKSSNFMWEFAKRHVRTNVVLHVQRDTAISETKEWWGNHSTHSYMHNFSYSHGQKSSRICIDFINEVVSPSLAKYVCTYVV